MAEAIITARDLVTIARTGDHEVNGQPVQQPPQLVTIDGVEWVEFYTGTVDAYTRYLIRADARVAVDVTTGGNTSHG